MSSVVLFLVPLRVALGQGDAESSALPIALRESMRATGLPASAFAIVVRPLGNGYLHVAFNETLPMRPASTMKLITTYAALELLGPAFRWRTEAFTAGPLHDDTLEGNLVIRGGGDPKLVVENLWSLVQKIRAYGVREIRGDLVLDRTAFEPIAHDAAAFDGEPLRPYNTGPDPLLLNFKTLSFAFVPDADTRTARVVVTPPLSGLKWPANVVAIDGPCGDWRAQLQGDFSNPLEPTFSGAFPLACGERVWNVSLLDHAAYFGAVFRALWEGTSGTWAGQLRDGTVPPEARRIAVQYSPPLAEVIRDINKFSNNVMARQLFLTLGGTQAGDVAGAERSMSVIRAWLASRALAMPELVLDNGSGLSRNERLSARSLTHLLRLAFDGPLMPEFVASLPIVGVDGTLFGRRRTGSAAHIKGGILEGVRAIAGYVRAESGRRYTVVVLVNHPSAVNAESFQDAVLEWIYAKG